MKSLESLIIRKIDKELTIPGDGSYPKKAALLLDGVHFGNVLCVLPCVLPARLFDPSSQLKSLHVVISSSADKTVKVTDTRTGQILTMLTHSTSPILAIDQHPLYPHIVVTAGMDGCYHIVNLETTELIQCGKDHSKYVVRAKFSPDGKFLVTASYDRTVNLYEFVPEGPGFQHVNQINCRGPVEAICFLPPQNMSTDIYTLVLGIREENYLHYVSLDKDAGFPSVKFNMNENGDDWVSFTPMHLEVSPSNKHIACYTDSSAGRIIIFRAFSSDQVVNLYGVNVDGFSQPRCCWDKTGKYIFATSDDYKVWVFDVVSGNVVEKLSGHSAVIRDLKLDKEAGRVVSCGFDKNIIVWD